MKNVLIIIILSLIVKFTEAQYFSPTISIYGGTTINTSLNEKSIAKNGFNLGGNLYFPFLNLSEKTNIGLILGGDAIISKNNFMEREIISNLYQLQGASFESIDQISSQKTKSSNIYFGIESRISFGKIFLSPSVSIGYFNHFNAPSSISVQIKDRSNEIQHINLIEREKSSYREIIIMPQAKLGYSITPKVGAFVSSSYISNKEFINEEKVFIPQGGLNDKNTYTIVQMLNGSQQIEKKITSRNLLNFNLGISIKVGKSLHQHNSNHKRTNKNNLLFGSIQHINIKNAKPINLTLNEKLTVIKLTEGNYELTVENKLYAQDFNTTRSNRENRLVVNPGDKIVTDSIPKHLEAQDFNTTRSNRDNRLIVNPGDKTANDSIPKSQEAQDFNTTRSNRDNRLTVNPGDKTANDSIPTRQEAKDFNTTRNNRDNRLTVNPGDKTANDSIPTRQEAQDFNTTRNNRDNRLIVNTGDRNANDTIPKRQEAQDFNTTRSNRDNRLIVNPGDKTPNDSISTRQEAQDFNTTRSNRDNRLYTNPSINRVLSIKNNKDGSIQRIPILTDKVKFQIHQKGKYSFKIEN